MGGDVERLANFLHLAWAAGKRRRPLVRCRFLVLAADEALRQGLASIAEYCRLEVLRSNPGHLVGKFPTFAAASQSADLAALLHQLHRRYSLERAEQMMQELGLSVAAERETYASDEEYAAALLGTSVEDVRAAVQASEDGDDTGTAE